MIRKIIISVFCLACLVMLSACGLLNLSKTKEFSGSGITVTLTDKFFEKEVVQAPFYLESQDHIFMGMRESKATVSMYGINTLKAYTEAVLRNGSVTADIETVDEDNVHYSYAYYYKTVGEQDFGYMLITMESDTYFYSMNFGCLKSNLEENKAQYFTWAKTITVE